MNRESERLNSVGEALFGPRWQTPLALALKVSDRTVRYWLAGEPIPPGVWGELGQLCDRRGDALKVWAQKLKVPR